MWRIARAADISTVSCRCQRPVHPTEKYHAWYSPVGSVHLVDLLVPRLDGCSLWFQARVLRHDLSVSAVMCQYQALQVHGIAPAHNKPLFLSISIDRVPYHLSILQVPSCMPLDQT